MRYVGDTDYSISPTDTLVIANAPFTAQRTWSLPQAGAENELQVQIVTGLDSVTDFTPLIIAAPALGNINGAATFLMTEPGVSLILTCIGPGQWLATAPAQVGSGMRGYSTTVTFATPGLGNGLALFRPAKGEMLVALNVVITQAWNSGTSDEVDLGVTGSADEFATGEDAQATGLVSVTGAVGYIFDGETDFLVTVVSDGTAATEGILSVTAITQPVTIPEVP